VSQKNGKKFKNFFEFEPMVMGTDELCIFNGQKEKKKGSGGISLCILGKWIFLIPLILYDYAI